MADAVAQTSFLNILRRSKFASFSPNIGQVYTSPLQSANRGDWGIKASVFAKGGGGARSQIRHLAIPEIDSVLGLPVWKSAEKTARFVRQWGGEGITARIEPAPGVHSWSTADGAEMDPWGAQAGRITQANKAIDKLHADKYYNEFINHKYTNLTQHHYLLHDFFFDRLVKSKFINAAILHDNDLPRLTTPATLSTPEDRIDVSELSEDEHLQAYYYLRSANESIAAEWKQLAEAPLDVASLQLAREHLRSKAVVLNEWARISAELQHLRQPYSHWKDAAVNVVQNAGDATEQARIQAKAVFAAQPQIVAQLRTPEGREQAEAQWKKEWGMLKTLAEKRGLTVAEWRKGVDSWDFDLRNVRAIEQAATDFFEASDIPEASSSSSPTSRLSSLPVFKQWDEIVDFSFSHRLPISNWREIKIAAEKEDVDALERARRAFVFRKGRVVYPDWLLTKDQAAVGDPHEWQSLLAERLEAVHNYGEVLFASDAVQREWKETLAALKKDGQSLEKYAEENEFSVERQESQDSALRSGPIATPSSSNFGVDQGRLLRTAPDVENMTDAEFVSYLETIKKLQPAYRRHLSEAFNSTRERRHRQISGLPSDDPSTPLAGRTHAAYGLLKAEGLSPKEEALKFIQKTFEDSPKTLNYRAITPLRHPTAGLAYSLPTKLETQRLTKAIPGLNLGARFVDGVPGTSSSRQNVSSIGGLVVGDAVTQGSFSDRNEPIDLGLGMDGNWRDKNLEPRDDTKGKYEYRIVSASINEPPRVVDPNGEKSSLLDARTINRGPWFKEQTLPPLRSNAKIEGKMVHPPYVGGNPAARQVAQGARVSALEANEKKSLRIGSPEWVAVAPRLTFGGVGGARLGRQAALPDWSAYRRKTAEGGGGQGERPRQSLGLQRKRNRQLIDSLPGSRD